MNTVLKKKSSQDRKSEKFSGTVLKRMNIILFLIIFISFVAAITAVTTGITNFIQDILFIIMNALLMPVMLFLITSLAILLFMLGKMMSEFVFRTRNRPDIEEIAFKISENITKDRFKKASNQIKKHLEECSNESRVLRRFLKDFSTEIGKGAKNLDIKIEKILQENESRTARLLDFIKSFIRLCPMAGLMGTLIPIGGALLSLSTGDINKMSSGLMIAFSTTVAGLAGGALAYTISLIRERWYESDMRTMEFLSEIVLRDLGIIDSGGER